MGKSGKATLPPPPGHAPGVVMIVGIVHQLILHGTDSGEGMCQLRFVDSYFQRNLKLTTAQINNSQFSLAH